MTMSIKHKLTIGFLMLFIISFLLSNSFIKNLVYRNSNNIIKNEMLNIQNYSREHISKLYYSKAHDFDLFHNEGENVAMDLAISFNSDIILYDEEGLSIVEVFGENKKLVIINRDEENEILDKDVRLALNNKSSFIVKEDDDKYMVCFSYPLYIEECNQGVIRFLKDYSHINNYNKKIIKGFCIFSIVMFTLLFCFTYYIIYKFTKPIETLSKGFKEVADGNYDILVDINTGDEMEELKDDFLYMKDKLKEQTEARTLFLNNITHELKTPLTTITGYAQIIGEEDFNDRGFLKRAAKSIESESKRLHEMVLKIIDISKKEKHMDLEPFTNVDLFPLLNSICDDLEIKASKYSITMKRNFEAISVRGQENELKKLFLNIIDNSIKHGKINSITSIDGMKEENLGVVVITNDSPNIDEEVMKNIFEPFYRGSSPRHNEKGNMGLGLYISKIIVDNHNGSIDLKNLDGKTIVTIKIPLWQ